MIKISAHYSKKVPADVEFSSRSYSASIEKELADGTPVEEIRKRLQALYLLLEEAVDEQIAAGEARARPGRDLPEPVKETLRGRAAQGTPRRDPNGRKATKAQIKAIYAIARDRGYPDEQLAEVVFDRFRAETPSELSIAQASSLIDLLKENGKEARL